MARVDYTEVELILGDEGEFDSAALLAFIDDASLWIDTNLVGKCSALTTAVLTAVEKYLAAHFASSRYAVLKSAKRGDTQEGYAGRGDDRVTPYLLTAASLDPCGIVQDLLVDGTDKTRGRAFVGRGYKYAGTVAQ